jgi:pimeloyl-ACP methyl ester carboxylesterase
MKKFFEIIRKNRTYSVIFILGTLTTLWLIGSFILFSVSPSLIFNNSVSISNQPDYGHEQVFLKNKEGKNISVWFFEKPQSERVILYMHGNSGRITDFFEGFYNHGSIVSPAYPGYHESEGSPTTENVYETGVLTYDWLVNEKGVSPENIVIIGHSLGGSPATYLASQRSEAKKLILINTFSSIQSMCFRDYTIFCTFSGGLLNTAKSAENVNIPVRQFYYTNDEVVPADEGKKLFEYFKNEDKKLFELTGDTHTYFNISEVFTKADEPIETIAPQNSQPQNQQTQNSQNQDVPQSVESNQPQP